MRRFDLNLLYTLRELLKEPNTTRVGEKLGLTQSAVSASLNRLRDTFRDDLLVRSGRAMKPTKRAERLLAPVEEILALVEELVEEVELDPKRLRRRFRIISAEYVLSNLMRPLMKAIEVEAPGVTVIGESATVEARARMRSGHIDLALAPLAPLEEAWSDIAHQPLYEDRLICIASKNNKDVAGGVTADQFLSLRHAVYKPDPTKDRVLSASEQFIADLGVQLNVVLEATSYAVLPGALLDTKLIATVPSFIFSLMPERDRLQAFDLPFEIEPFTVSLIWNGALNSDVQHQWFRETVARKFAEVRADAMV
ncbi:MAG: LysR family transcriptional regulator [Caulobacterales bacterium]|nr:LysR family transcriptional regulator [Caulobacterales bacterium]